MSYLIAGVIMIALVAVLTLFMGKNGGGSTKDKKTSNRNKAQIIKEANKKLAKNPHDPAGLIPLGDVYFSSQIWAQENHFSWADGLEKQLFVVN